MKRDHERSCDGRRLAVVWAKEHWQVAAFVCACIPWIGVILNYFDVLSAPAAVVAVIVSVVYVVVLTWAYTFDRDKA